MRRSDESPELNFVLSSIRRFLDHESAKGSGDSQLNWSRVQEIAKAHGVLPLLARKSDEAPDLIRAHLQEQERLMARRNLQMTSELLALSDLFDERGIPMLPYKGPVLAQQLYGDLNLRISQDLDILVPRKHVPEAIATLESRGYTLPPLIRNLWRPYMRLDHHFLMSRDDGEVVELHWAFTPPSFSFDLDIDGLWNRLGSMPIAGRTIPVIGPEDLVLILAVHGAKDFWQRLMWVVDIAQLLRRYPEINWRQVTDQAKCCGVLRLLLVALFLANDILDAPLPEEITQEIRRDPVARSLAAEFRDRLLHSRTFRKWERIRLEFKIRERLTDRIRFGLRQVFAPTLGDFDLVRLPPGLFFLYPLVRGARLFAKHILGKGSTTI